MYENFRLFGPENKNKRLTGVFYRHNGSLGLFVTLKAGKSAAFVTGITVNLGLFVTQKSGNWLRSLHT